MASNIIGVIEIVTVVLLSGWWWNKTACMYGLLLAAVTFIAILSFLVSFPESWNTQFGGFPYLASTGHFLMKDLLMLAATVALAAEIKQYR